MQKLDQAPFFSRGRFGPGMISILSILVALVIILIFYLKLYYLAFLPAIVAIFLFGVKYFELIQSPKPTEKKLIGQTCLVIKKVTRNERGIVRIHKEGGDLDPELWSAELATIDNTEIQENQTAKVVGIRSVILLIEPQ